MDALELKVQLRVVTDTHTDRHTMSKLLHPSLTGGVISWISMESFVMQSLGMGLLKGHDTFSRMCLANILSRASEAGSPTNRPGSDKTHGQGSFGPSTGGPD